MSAVLRQWGVWRYYSLRTTDYKTRGRTEVNAPPWAEDDNSTRKRSKAAFPCDSTISSLYALICLKTPPLSRYWAIKTQGFNWTGKTWKALSDGPVLSLITPYRCCVWKGRIWLGWSHTHTHTHTSARTEIQELKYKQDYQLKKYHEIY